MNQILTDAEITLIIRECARGSAINRDGSTSHRIARAIEQAILNKLSEQEPVCYGNQTALDNMLDDRVAEVAGVRDGWRKTPLYLHQAPSVPKGYVLVPVDPEGQWSNSDLINIMVDAYQDSNGGYYDSMLAAYKAMLSARSE